VPATATNGSLQARRARVWVITYSNRSFELHSSLAWFMALNYVGPEPSTGAIHFS
jgi:hypothetical protein